MHQKPQRCVMYRGVDRLILRCGLKLFLKDELAPPTEIWNQEMTRQQSDSHAKVLGLERCIVRNVGLLIIKRFSFL